MTNELHEKVPEKPQTTTLMMSCTGNDEEEELKKEEPKSTTMIMSCTDNDDDKKEEPRRERVQPSTMMIPNHAKASELPPTTQISGEVEA